jgi:hypothetical protein
MGPILNGLESMREQIWTCLQASQLNNSVSDSEQYSKVVQSDVSLHHHQTVNMPFTFFIEEFQDMRFVYRLCNGDTTVAIEQRAE